jgi:hypothetical protein
MRKRKKESKRERAKGNPFFLTGPMKTPSIPSEPAIEGRELEQFERET